VKLPEITEHGIWSAGECADVANMVKALPDYWIDRGVFWTVGAATYQDPPRAYTGIANACNVVLDHYFYSTPSFAKFMECMRWVYDANVVVMQDFARPSFHVFTDKANGLNGSLHVDEPYKSLALPEGWHSPTSFTMAVEMPKKGGGLNYWANETLPIHKEFHQDDNLPPPDAHLEYELGVLYKHDGLFYHQISNNHHAAPDDFRITLQGHTVTLPTGDVMAYF
tara:strand:- start:26090 stop:26761 length:672 start_codon:yes stop_codon:yes gene_type:complete